MIRAGKEFLQTRLSPLLRRLGFAVPWTFEEIQREWFGDAHLHWDRDDVVRAFNLAESIRGRNWVLGREVDVAALSAFPGIDRRGGYSEFLRVYWFGKRMASIVGALGCDDLIERLMKNDSAASEEATAVHLLRSRQPNTELEIAPKVKVGNRYRRPDFRLRKVGEPWIYVEVTKLNESTASIQIERLLQRVAERVITVDQAFLLEIVFNRDPTASEEEEVLAQAKAACNAADGHRKDVGDFASILVRSGDPSVVVPSLIPDDNRPRMAISRSLVGDGQPNRQMVVRIPFQDQRAEDILRTEAKQLPRNECSIVMVNVNRQPSAFESWSERVPERFTAGQHTRVAAVVLFMHSTTATANGLVWIPFVKLIANPHARIPLPSWITDTVDGIRADARRLTGRPD
jgi:hypothetical protein